LEDLVGAQPGWLVRRCFRSRRRIGPALLA